MLLEQLDTPPLLYKELQRVVPGESSKEPLQELRKIERGRGGRSRPFGHVNMWTCGQIEDDEDELHVTSCNEVEEVALGLPRLGLAESNAHLDDCCSVAMAGTVGSNL